MAGKDRTGLNSNPLMQYVKADDGLKQLKKKDIYKELKSASYGEVFDYLQQVYDYIQEDDSRIQREVIDKLQKAYLKTVKELVSEINQCSGSAVDQGSLKSYLESVDKKSLVNHQVNFWQISVIGYTHISGEIYKLLQKIPKTKYSRSPILDYTNYLDFPYNHHRLNYLLDNHNSHAENLQFLSEAYLSIQFISYEKAKSAATKLLQKKFEEYVNEKYDELDEGALAVIKNAFMVGQLLNDATPGNSYIDSVTIMQRDLETKLLKANSFGY